MDNMIFGKL